MTNAKRDEMASGNRAQVEQQLLALLRDEDDDNFTLTITHSDGRWTVTKISLDDPASQMQGTGSDFAEAWHLAENPLFKPT
ncbi:hypothetical protein [Bradyrhizobium zhanjiangense]|uniref:Uncharacterized protein n=1 Tax=Bradyrhizobium zhanjiangense TaxID=1325107 RepID=A0A4Q0SMN0_9BRAD|nr:hypothetical protein [Bradyrhizobium zhanjiangense]RXH41075.1 hypothetical protein XH94_09535 [Bradyrhizobium zhanjiangense]